MKLLLPQLQTPLATQWALQVGGLLVKGHARELLDKNTSIASYIPTMS